MDRFIFILCLQWSDHNLAFANYAKLQPFYFQIMSDQFFVDYGAAADILTAMKGQGSLLHVHSEKKHSILSFILAQNLR